MIKSTIYGACSSMAEYMTVDHGVVGSTPIRHPKKIKQGFLKKKPCFFLFTKWGTLVNFGYVIISLF